jgi:hypothetical protein
MLAAPAPQAGLRLGITMLSALRPPSAKIVCPVM